MAVKALTSVSEFGLSASLYKDVRTHPPKPKSYFRDEIETPRERESQRAHSVPILFYYNRVFL